MYQNKKYYLRRFTEFTADEAYDFVMESCKRPSFDLEFQCAKGAWEEFYKDKFQSPQERKIAKLESKVKEFEGGGAEPPEEKEAPADEKANETEEAPVGMSKEEFRDWFREKERKIGNPPPAPLVWGRAYKKYLNR